jgi:hypothetical protein
MSDPAHTALANAGTPGGTSPSGAVESPNHEPSTISLRGIVIFTVWFVVIGVAIHVMLWLVFKGYLAFEAAQDVSVTAVVQERRLAPPEPRLQRSEFHDTLPREDLEAMENKSKEEFAKRTPSWVDPATDKIRIPDEVVASVARLPHATAAARPATQPNRK